MNIRIFLAVALACTLAVPAATMASHFSQYAFDPQEHDDMGSSTEPDHASTSVLGPLVLNHVIDTNNDWSAEPDSSFAPGQVLAPGCTDNAGRQPDGLCGAWTVGVGCGRCGNVVPRHTSAAGVPVGVVEGKGPGITGKGARTVNFLDAKVGVSLVTVGTMTFDLNKKFSDLPVAGTLKGAGFGDFISPGSDGMWAWFGTWSDLNGNGVIDRLQHKCANPDNSGCMYADNEFTWSGNCLQFLGKPDGNSERCHIDPAGLDASGNPTDRMAAFVFPGNHHSTCGGALEAVAATECALLPADMPGKQVIGVVDALTIPATGPALGAVGFGPGVFGVVSAPECNTPFFTDPDTACETDINKADSNDAVAYGDPLLGEQNLVTPDQNYDDRSGDPDPTAEMFVYGDGWPIWYYDSSLILDTTIVSTMGCPNVGRSVDLAHCRFADVDNYKAWTPATSDLLSKTVKPTARSEWVFARAKIIPVQATESGITTSYLVYSAGNQGATQGMTDDQLQNPGWSREPNTAGDRYPGVTAGACADAAAQRNGWCNTYSLYQNGFHAWTDVQAFRAEFWSFPIGSDAGSSCILCVSGATITVGPALNLPHGGGPYSRTLQPGGYNFIGVLGMWHDAPQTWKEDYLSLDTSNPSGLGQEVVKTYTRPADGWVGNVVNVTGTFYYRGYADQKCKTEQDPIAAGTHTFAQCNPYLDGNVQDPNQAGDLSNGEWQGRCHDSTLSMTLHPDGGKWTVPVVVFRNHASEHDVLSTGTGDDRDLLKDISLLSGADLNKDIVIGMDCSASSSDGSGFYASHDMIYLPLGNQGLKVTTTLTAHVNLDDGTPETVVDQDVYEGWNA